MLALGAERAAAEDGALYRRFLEVARGRGVDAALCFAAENLPEDFCKNFGQLKKAAKFMKAQGEISREAASKAEPPEESPLPRAAAAGPSEAVLRVCNKCVRKLQRKGNAFDVASALADLSVESIAIESVTCMKQCKLGPNVQVVHGNNPEGVPVTVEGMTPEEVGNCCFHRITNAAAAKRVVDAVERSLAPVAAAAPAPEEPVRVGPAQLEQAQGAEGARAVGAPPLTDAAAAERARRERVRTSIRSRISHIVAGLDDEEL